MVQKMVPGPQVVSDGSCWAAGEVSVPCQPFSCYVMYGPLVRLEPNPKPHKPPVQSKDNVSLKSQPHLTIPLQAWAVNLLLESCSAAGDLTLCQVWELLRQFTFTLEIREN